MPPNHQRNELQVAVADARKVGGWSIMRSISGLCPAEVQKHCACRANANVPAEAGPTLSGARRGIGSACSTPATAFGAKS